MRIKSVTKVLNENMLHRAEQLRQSLLDRADKMGAVNSGMGSKASAAGGAQLAGADKYSKAKFKKRRVDMWFSLVQNIRKSTASEFRISGDHYYAKLGNEHVFTDVNQEWILVFSVKESALDLVSPTIYTIKDIAVYLNSQNPRGGIRPQDKLKLEKAKFVLVSLLQKRT